METKGDPAKQLIVARGLRGLLVSAKNRRGNAAVF